MPYPGPTGYCLKSAFFLEQSAAFPVSSQDGRLKTPLGVIKALTPFTRIPLPDLITFQRSGRGCQQALNTITSGGRISADKLKLCVVKPSCFKPLLLLFPHTACELLCSCLHHWFTVLFIHSITVYLSRVSLGGVEGAEASHTGL